ncbi:hypothetical protein MBLNU13_g09733t1 [Cladosporium sp. NU13]
MSSVQAYYRHNGGAIDLIGVFDGDRIKAHSALIRSQIATLEPNIIYRVYLRGPTFESLKVVLQEIDSAQVDEVFQIAIKTRDIQKAINIHSAIQYLQVEPEQTKVVGHFHGYVSHQLVNPDEMVALYLAYGNPDGRFHKIFEVMIQDIAWRYLQGTIPRRQGDLLKEASLRYPAIDAAISAKIVELRREKQRKEEQARKKAARNAGGR